MPNKNETGVSREDARNAEEALFGDMADDPADGQEAKSKTDKEPQGSDVAEQQAGPPEDLKVVVSIREGRATIGVQRPSSDPHIESFDEPDPSELVREVSAVIERASARWEEVPKYPAHARPASPARRRRSREQGSTQDSTAEEEAAQDQPETLRLVVVTRTATCPLRPHVSGLFAFRSGTRGGAPGSDGVEMCAMVRIGSGASMEEQSPCVDIWGAFAFSGRHVPCSGNGARGGVGRH